MKNNDDEMQEGAGAVVADLGTTLNADDIFEGFMSSLQAQNESPLMVYSNGVLFEFHRVKSGADLDAMKLKCTKFASAVGNADKIPIYNNLKKWRKMDPKRLVEVGLLHGLMKAFYVDIEQVLNQKGIWNGVRSKAPVWRALTEAQWLRFSEGAPTQFSCVYSMVATLLAGIADVADSREWEDKKKAKG